MDEHKDMQIARRFGGMERLYGVDGAARIRQACVAVIGVGGVGSWSAEALARSGVGAIVLVDMDHVAPSNINRQIHALTPTIGQAKIEAMAERIAQINPACQLSLVDDFASPDNWPQLLPVAVDGVIDACDQVRTKAAIAAWALRHKQTVIAVGAAGGKRQAHAVDIADLAATTHDPLLAQVRYRLRREYGAARTGKIGLPCVYSKEAVAPPDASCAIEGEGDGSLNCSGYGSMVAVTATFGMAAAGWMVEQLSRSRAKK